MIGVFDSGHGGLTILHAAVEAMPRQRYLYLGDHAHAPYGERPAEEVYAFTQRHVEWLFRAGCRLVLLACNTAAAVALRRLQQTWLPGAYPERRVLGVLVPMVEAVTRVPWHVKIPPPGTNPPEVVGVFGTPRTVESGAYPTEIRLRSTHITVVQQACPGLVSGIEEGAPDDEICAMVQGYVTALRAQLGGGVPDSAILGCTHYALVAKVFAETLPPGVRILSQPDLVAASLTDYLSRRPEFGAPTQDDEAPRFFTTGDPDRVVRLARRFYGGAARYERVPAAPELKRARTPG